MLASVKFAEGVLNFYNVLVKVILYLMFYFLFALDNRALSIKNIFKNKNKPIPELLEIYAPRFLTVHICLRKHNNYLNVIEMHV